MGDFNLPDINWLTLSGSTGLLNQFCDLVFDSNLLQLFNQPTHICGNILNFILTNCDDHINSLSVHSHNSHLITSDHYLISFDLSTVIVRSHSDNGPTAYICNPAIGDYDGLNS